MSARTFDTLGVTSFQALQAPYLVTSNELADKVLADPVTDSMLDGTKTLGLVGLGLAFDFLAYPGGFGQPVLTPADYAGKAFQVRPSRANDLLVQALGGTSDPRNGQDLEKAVAAKEVEAAGRSSTAERAVRGEIFTANEPAFLRANVIVMNDKVFAGLSATQQQALRDAAAQTRDWMATRHQYPVAMAAAYCSGGDGSIAIATPEQLAAMKAATAPVVAALEQEEVTRAGDRPYPRTRTRNTPTADAERMPGEHRTLRSPRSPPEGTRPRSTALATRGRSTGPPGRGPVPDGRHQQRRHLDLDLQERWRQLQGTGDRVCTITYVLNGKKFLGIGYDPGCDGVLPLVVERSGEHARGEALPRHHDGTTSDW